MPQISKAHVSCYTQGSHHERSGKGVGKHYKRKVGSKIASQGRVTRSEKEERQEAAACAPAQIQNGAAPSGAMPTAEREARKRKGGRRQEDRKYMRGSLTPVTIRKLTFI